MSDTILEQFARMENKIEQLQAELDTAKIEIRKYKELYNKASVEASLQFRAYADEIEKYQAKLKHLFRF